MTFEAFIEVEGAHDSVCDSRKNQKKSDNTEESKGMTGRTVFRRLRRLIHSHKLEEKVRRASDVKKLGSVNVRKIRSKRLTLKGAAYNDHNHANSVLFASEKGGKEENYDRHRDSSNCECELCVGLSGDNDDKLDSESKKEEKVKLQKGNINLSQ